MSKFQNGKFQGQISSSSSGGATATGSEQFEAKVGDTQFTVTAFTLNASFGKVYVDGIFQTSDKFTISGQVVTFAVAMLGGEIVNITN